LISDLPATKSQLLIRRLEDELQVQLFHIHLVGAPGSLDVVPGQSVPASRLADLGLIFCRPPRTDCARLSRKPPIKPA
jgi:hypothetical protein